MGNNCCTESHAPDNYNTYNSNSSKREKNSVVASQPGMDPTEIYRFFMVGMGSAGKSTVIKQLQKLCHDRPNIYKMYDEEWKPISHEFASHEKERYRRIIRRNVFDALSILEYYVQTWSLRPSSSSDADVIADMAGNLTASETKLEKHIMHALLRLIKDPAIQAALNRRSEMIGTQQIADGTIPLLTEEKMAEIFSDSYSPSENDIVHSRSPTTGIQDYRFGVRGMRIQIHDIGGQKVERGKLLSYITNWVSADRSGYRNFILYVVSMAEYNIPHPEHKEITLLDESLMMMQNILELQPIQNCGFMIFFNKDDVYREKLRQCSTMPALRDDTLKWLGQYMKENDKATLRKGAELSHDAMQKVIAKKFTDAIKNIQTKRYKGIYRKYVTLHSVHSIHPHKLTPILQSFTSYLLLKFWLHSPRVIRFLRYH
ncbi:hypothetical protein PMAYCL1PPCAC_12870 [Pristionchus mayeri]|uniref:G-protein alpha subunit n=1 Tax=Pristionchus mayeri TaxID=1317129 RepID=A0AAN4ZT44_9BILA|nr:hypothetical protein PMAYCL1PPCAC_12870 [Pristionchus mayeri]